MSVQLLKLQQPLVHSLQKTQDGMQSVVYRGRPLSQAEAMGVKPSFYLSRSTLTLLVSGWIALAIVFTTPIASFATLMFAPIVLSVRRSNAARITTWNSLRRVLSKNDDRRSF